MPRENPLPRMRLEDGFSHLRADLGDVIRERRLTLKRRPLSQARLAQLVGITRVALLRIEKNQTWPRPGTLYQLLDVLDLQIEDVAVVGDNPRPRRERAGVEMLHLGRCLRDVREERKWSLARVSRLSGVSASQLSRIERGVCGRSGVFGLSDDDPHLATADRPIVFVNDVLRRLTSGELNDEEENA